MNRSILLILITALLWTSGYPADRPQVGSIEFFGNEHYSSAKLHQLMGTKENRFYKESRFYNDVLIRDLKDIIDFYYLHGFQKAGLEDLRIEWSDDSSMVDLKIYLNEGRPVIVDSISLTGVEKLPLQKVRKNLYFKTGDRLDLEVLEASSDAITGYYARQGYLDVRVLSRTDKNDSTANVAFEIYEGNEHYYHGIEVSGNARTKTWIIEKALRLKEGDEITLGNIEAFQRRLIKQGLYSSVKVSTDHFESDSLVNIIVDVVEKEPGEFSFGGGFGSEERARTAALLSYINLAGRAAALSIEGKLSKLDRSTALKHYAPYILRSGLHVRALTSYSRQIEPNFDREKIEAAASIGYNFSEWIRLACSYKFRRTTLSNLPLDLQDIYGGELFNLYGLELAADFRDNQIYTRRGIYGAVNGAISNPKGFGKADFLRGGFDFRAYRDFLSKVVAAVQIKSGSLLKLDLESIPLEERFFLGGTNSLRGYDRNSLGPRTSLGTPQGGNFYYFIRSEIRADVYLPVFIKIFIDNGALYKSLSAARIDGTSTSAGLGIGALWGVWSARLEYAWRLEDTVKPGRIHFQVGQTF